jgi:O-antigen/teichoic acid export membrane protein
MDRTRLGLKLTLITIISTIILGLISLIRVKIILENYGPELNGLMQVAVQMSTYLILLESGMTAAYQYKMYDKINKNNIEDLSSLYSGLIVNMRKIGIMMMLVSISFPFIYSLFVNRIEISYMDAVLVLLVMGVRFTVPYLLVIPQWGILAAFERQYLVDIIQLLMNIVVIVLEVYVIFIFKPPLYLVLLIYILCLLITVPIYKLIVEKVTKIKIGNNVKPDMSPKNMTNDILVHQISSVVFFNTDNMLLSLFKNLESVTMYSAYNTLISFPNQIINKVVGGLRASLALKIQGEDDNAFDVYNEILSIESFFASIVVPMFILLSNTFVALWIGEEYTLKYIDIVLFALIILNRMITPVILAARDAKGLYKESKNYTIMQAVSNIVISVLLIKPFGITGVLIGTLASTYVISTPFNIYLVNKEVFKKKSNVLLKYIKILLVSMVVLLIEKALSGYISFESTWMSFIIETIYLFGISLVVSSFVYLMSDTYFRMFINRLLTFRRL